MNLARALEVFAHLPEDLTETGVFSTHLPGPFVLGLAPLGEDG